MENQIYNAALAAKAQKEYCKKTSSPHFAPGSGICWSCKKNIYTQIEYKGRDGIKVYTSGISVEKAEKELVTGCPHCNRSYCD